MQSTATIEWSDSDGFKCKTFVNLDPMEAAELVASRHGYFNLDLDSDDNGLKLIATGHRKSVTVKGRNKEELVQRFLDRITSEGEVLE